MHALSFTPPPPSLSFLSFSTSLLLTLFVDLLVKIERRSRDFSNCRARTMGKHRLRRSEMKQYRMTVEILREPIQNKNVFPCNYLSRTLGCMYVAFRGVSYRLFSRMREAGDAEFVSL